MRNDFCAKVKDWYIKVQQEQKIKSAVLIRFIIRFITVWLVHKSQIRFPKAPHITEFIGLLSQYKFTSVSDPAILGEVFETLLEAESCRKNTGSFYTSPEIVRHMVESALCKYFCTETGENEADIQRWIANKKFPAKKTALFLQKLKQVKILDPACGSGAFIMTELEILLQLWNALEHGKQEELQRKEFLLQNNIFGCDIQPMAVYITKLRCRLTLDGKTSALHIMTADTLSHEWREKFDIVLGNPPYVPICQIPPAYRKQLQKNCRFATARFNLFYLFIEKSFDLLKEAGTAELIVPDRLLKNTQCVQLRKWVLYETDLYKIVTFPHFVFKSAVIDPVIIAFQKRQPQRDTIRCCKWEDKSFTEVPCIYFRNAPNFQLDLNCNQAQFELLQKIRSQSVELGKIADIRDGIIQGAVADQLFLNTPKDNFSKPLLIGEDIRPYQITFADRWVNYHPDEMMKLERNRRQNPGLRLRKKSIFELNKILTRQTADRIIAVYDTDHYYYCNTLHGTTVTSPEYDPLFVTAILNSRLMTWLYRTETSETGQTFAQVKIAVLKKLPILRCPKEKQKEISRYAALLHTASENAERQKTHIDQCLYRLYHLSEQEIAVIEENRISRHVKIPGSVP